LSYESKAPPGLEPDLRSAAAPRCPSMPRT